MNTNRTRRLCRMAACGVLLIAALAPAARANVPAPVTISLPLRVPALGNASDGTLSATLTYTDTTATASASTGNTVWLGKGAYFKLSTCVAYHQQSRVPASTCADRYVDTRANTGTIYTSAPSVALPRQARPTGSARAWFTAYTQVAYRTGNAYTLVSHSWPDAGLQGAGLPIAAQNASSATLPPNATVRVDGTYNGQINSGQPDSICTAQPVAANGSAVPAGVRMSHPAFAGAPTYYELGAPTGAYAGQIPRGTVLVIHGGGWSVNGVGAVQASRGEADRWRARGFQTVNLTYRACALSITDVLWYYDKTRLATGSAPICATGISAGGNLALLLAVYRSDVYCVESIAGPTDLRTIRSQKAYDPTTGTLSQTNGGRWVHNLSAAAFGAENLTWFGPAAQASGSLKTTRVLQGFSADDALVPWQQATELRDAMLAADPRAYIDTVQLPKGTVPFGHGTATQAAADDFYAREARLIAGVPGGR